MTAAPFYPTGSGTVESVVESALLDTLDAPFDLDIEIDNLSISSSIGTGPTSASGILGHFSNNGSDPVSIPGSEPLRHSSFSHNSQSPTSPGIAARSSSFYSGGAGSLGQVRYLIS